MPSRRFRLNKTEQRAAARKLLARGLISRIPTWLESPPVLDIRIDPMASEVVELPSGQVYFAVWVELVAREAGVNLVHSSITTRWDDQIVLGSDEVNAFCGSGGPAYSHEAALNARIERVLRFRRRGDLVRGTLFFWGLRPIPDACRSDALVRCELTFTDSLGNEFAKRGKLRVNRWRRPRMPIPKESLYAGVVPDSESIRDRQRRAYLEVRAKELADQRKSDPDRKLDTVIERKRECLSELVQLSPPPPISHSKANLLGKGR